MIKIYKDDEVREVDTVDAYEICEHNGWSMNPPHQKVNKKNKNAKKDEPEIVIEEGE